MINPYVSKYRKKYKNDKTCYKVVKPRPTFAKKVTKVLNRRNETKYHTNLAAVQTFGNDDPTTQRIHVSDLTDVAQSAGASSDTTRIGDEVTLTRLACKIFIEQRAFAGANIGTVNRVIILQWKPDSVLTNSLASMTQIFQPGPSAAGTNDYNSMSFYAHDQRSQYRILYDHSFNMSDQASSNNSTITRVFDCPLKKAVKKISYTAAATTGPNHIYLIVVGLLPELVSYLTYDIRMFFKDS